ncbi:MAG: DUF4956 domain-containing protein [Planctomycetota bacterium]|jgi:uncharacterized membrane protein YhiD involved in acid resistance
MGPDIGLSQLSFQTSISVKSTLIYIAISAVLSLIASWHFKRFGSVFSNREKFARILPATAMITTLVICVVKASLALSLGLVGALSIVRFRTPIKEPEELIYLFLSIAIGLGSGAGHWKLTPVAVIAILVILTIRAVMYKESVFSNLYVMVSIPTIEGQKEPGEELIKMLQEKSVQADIRRLDCSKDETNIALQMACKDTSELFSVKKMVTEKFPDAAVSYIEQSGLPGA